MFYSLIATGLSIEKVFTGAEELFNAVMKIIIIKNTPS